MADAALHGAADNAQPPSNLPKAPKASSIKQNTFHSATRYSAVSQVLNPQRQERERLTMDGKISLVEYDFMLDEYFCSTTGCPVPSDEEFAAQSKFRGIVLKPEAQMNKNLVSANIFLASHF